MHRCAIAIGVMAGLSPISLGGVVSLNFDTEDDLISPLANGQLVSSPEKFGNLVNINGFGANTLGAAAFDSTPGGVNSGGPDPDLLVGLGNVLILQSMQNPNQSVAGIFDLPNDSPLGGTFVFSFMTEVEMREVTIIDVDAGNHVLVTLLDSGGRTRIYDVPAGWSNDIQTHGPNGYDTLDLTSLDDQLGEGGQTASAFEDDGFDSRGVVFVSIEMSGSGAIDNFTFSTIPSPGSVTLLLAGAGVGAVRRRRRN